MHFNTVGNACAALSPSRSFLAAGKQSVWRGRVLAAIDLFNQEADEEGEGRSFLHKHNTKSELKYA
jgi:hypothetical protein